LHAQPQLAPSHVGCEFAGPGGHGVHSVPHVDVDVLLAQTPLQLW
jgi:hypothetical protein